MLAVVGLVGGATVLFGAGVALARLVVPGRRLVVLGRRLGGGAAVLQFVAGVARAWSVVLDRLYLCGPVLAAAAPCRYGAWCWSCFGER